MEQMTIFGGPMPKNLEEARWRINTDEVVAVLHMEKRFIGAPSVWRGDVVSDVYLCRANSAWGYAKSERVEIVFSVGPPGSGANLVVGPPGSGANLVVGSPPIVVGSILTIDSFLISL